MNKLKEIEEKEVKALLSSAIAEKENKKRKILAFLLPFIVLFSSMCIYFWHTSSFWESQRTITSEEIVASLVASLVVGGITTLILQYLDESKIQIYKSRLISLGIEDAKKNVDEDIYQNLIKISYKYLDEYYLQTRQQAQRGFLVTMCVSVMGAIIIAIGIVAMFFGKTTPAYITTASGVITEFVAAVFFYLYNRTISSMGDYHNKLVLSQNISIALKIAESLSDEAGERIKEHIVDELIKDVNIHIHSENLKEKSE